MKAIPALIDDYLRHLSIERGLAKNTISSYRRDLRNYSEFLERNGITEPSQISEETIKKYLEQIGSSGILIANSVARMLASVRGLHRFWLFESITQGDSSARV